MHFVDLIEEYSITVSTLKSVVPCMSIADISNKCRNLNYHTLGFTASNRVEWEEYNSHVFLLLLECISLRLPCKQQCMYLQSNRLLFKEVWNILKKKKVELADFGKDCRIINTVNPWSGQNPFQWLPLARPMLKAFSKYYFVETNDEPVIQRVENMCITLKCLLQSWK